LSTRIDRYTQQIASINDEIRGVSDTHSEMEKELIEEYSKQDKAKLEKRLSQVNFIHLTKACARKLIVHCII